MTTFTAASRLSLHWRTRDTLVQFRGSPVLYTPYVERCVFIVLPNDHALYESLAAGSIYRPMKHKEGFKANDTKQRKSLVRSENRALRE